MLPFIFGLKLKMRFSWLHRWECYYFAHLQYWAIQYIYYLYPPRFFLNFDRCALAEFCNSINTHPPDISAKLSLRNNFLCGQTDSCCSQPIKPFRTKKLYTRKLAVSLELFDLRIMPLFHLSSLDSHSLSSHTRRSYGFRVEEAFWTWEGQRVTFTLLHFTRDRHQTP